MDALEGDGDVPSAAVLAWDSTAKTWKTGTTNAKGDLEGCDENNPDGTDNKHTTACFDATNTAAWPGDVSTTVSNQDQADAYDAVFSKCQKEGTDGTNAQCKSCGFSLVKDSQVSLKAPQRCRKKHMQCGRGKSQMAARIDVLEDEMAALSEAKQIMYQKEADFHAASKFENALFFLQTDSEEDAVPHRNDDHNADLQPIVTKMVNLINSEQDKRATNAFNYNSCNTQIADLKNDFDVAESMVRALKDKVQAYSEDVAYYKDAIRQLTTDLNDIETNIHRLYNAHQDDLKRLENEISQMDPLITTVEEVRSALLGDSTTGPRFDVGDQIIILVDRLKADLVHEKEQLNNEKTEAEEDYSSEDQDLADQKLSVLTRRGDQQAQMASARNKLTQARTDMATAKTTSQDEYEEFHQKSVECNHLLTKFNEIQAALDEHIGQLRQMLGLFTNLAKLPSATDQLHVSSVNRGCRAVNQNADDKTHCETAARNANQNACEADPDGQKCKWAPTYNAGWQSNIGGDPTVEDGIEDAQRVSNKDAAMNAAPDLPSAALASGSADYPGAGGAYLGNAQNPI